MREIQASQITEVIERLCIEANTVLPEDMKQAIQTCRACEDGEIARGVLDNIIENYQIAEAEEVPICQDTGMACVFLEIGQDVHIAGGDLTEAVNEGVRRGYDKGYLRKSVVKDPVRRGNTGDNTPAMLYLNCQIKVPVLVPYHGNRRNVRRRYPVEVSVNHLFYYTAAKGIPVHTFIICIKNTVLLVPFCKHYRERACTCHLKICLIRGNLLCKRCLISKRLPEIQPEFLLYQEIR